MPGFADCTIVMLAHNGRQFTAHCLESLRQSDPLPAQFIFIDNGSTDDTPALARRHGDGFRAAGVDFVLQTNAENLGCSLARNQGWARAARPYVVFLDNDTAVCSRNWLGTLTAALAADARLGVLGPKLIYPFRPHPIQCAGVAINPLGRIRFRGRGCRRDAPEYAVGTRVPALISACWIMRREFLQTLGGLDEWFHPVQYEDLDFCLRVNQAGFHCAYSPAVELYHFEGRTTAALGAAAYQRNIVAQSAKFRQRWAPVLKTYPPDPADYRWLTDTELGLTADLDLALDPPAPPGA